MPPHRSRPSDPAPQPGPGRHLALTLAVEPWPLRQPFHITGHVFTTIPVLVVHLSDGRHCGRGEAAGVYYRKDEPAAAAARLENLRPTIEAGLTAPRLQTLLPPGGARNALDCALWDLTAQQTGTPVWALAGLDPPQPLRTTFTIGADTPAAMAAASLTFAPGTALKLKLTGDPHDMARVAAVRAACPESWIGVDANQGFTRDGLIASWDALCANRVGLVEQPFPIGQESWLDGMARPIPVAADESVQCLADIDGLHGRFDVVNIKLDKSGGLSEGLAMARHARSLGLSVMVGNMMGTSLAMAPGFVLGQICDLVDLDGPIFLSQDRPPAITYRAGMMAIETPFWGHVAVPEPRTAQLAI